MTSLDASGSQQAKDKFSEFLGNVKYLSAMDNSH